VKRLKDRGVAKIQCTICGDWIIHGTPHTHNPEGSPINEIEELEKIFDI